MTRKKELDYELLGEMAVCAAQPQEAASCQGMSLKSLERRVRLEKGMTLENFLQREKWARVCTVRKNERALTAKDARMAIWIEENLFAPARTPEPAAPPAEFRDEYVDPGGGA